MLSSGRVVLVLNGHRECQIVCAHHFSLTYGEQLTSDPLADTEELNHYALKCIGSLGTKVPNLV